MCTEQRKTFLNFGQQCLSWIWEEWKSGGGFNWRDFMENWEGSSFCPLPQSLFELHSNFRVLLRLKKKKRGKHTRLGVITLSLVLFL